MSEDAVIRKLTTDGGMTYARNFPASLRDTRFYNINTRCVRRAFLWGYDTVTGKDYSHRKAWMIERLQLLVMVFAIDCCAYAVMSNHYHLVLAVALERAKAWDQREVVLRWAKLFRLPRLVQRWLDEQASEAEAMEAEKIIERWRDRLYDISWFMRCLNQHLAERANAEDGVTGHFWQSRFHSQALLDEAGLLSAMAYVDLNPVRAGVAESLQESQFTSIYQRIQELRAKSVEAVDTAEEELETAAEFDIDADSRPTLVAFQNDTAETTEDHTIVATRIPGRLEDYVALLEWTARRVHSNDAAHVASGKPSILQSLRIDAAAWEQSMRPCGNVFGRAMGRLNRLRHHAEILGQCWIRGLGQARRLYEVQLAV